MGSFRSEVCRLAESFCGFPQPVNGDESRDRLPVSNNDGVFVVLLCGVDPFCEELAGLVDPHEDAFGPSHSGTVQHGGCTPVHVIALPSASRSRCRWQSCTGYGTVGVVKTSTTSTHKAQILADEERRARAIRRANARRAAEKRRPYTSVTTRVDPFALLSAADDDLPF